MDGLAGACEGAAGSKRMARGCWSSSKNIEPTRPSECARLIGLVSELCLGTRVWWVLEHFKGRAVFHAISAIATSDLAAAWLPGCGGGGWLSELRAAINNPSFACCLAVVHQSLMTIAEP